MSRLKAKWAALGSFGASLGLLNILGCHFSDWTQPLFPGPLQGIWNILFLNPAYQWATRVFDI